MKPNDLYDLHRIMEEWAGKIDLKQYEEDVIDSVTLDILDYIREENPEWRWGQEVDLSEEKFWEFFKPYEK